MVTRRRLGRRGVSTIGCLASLVVTLVVLYYGINLGRVWWRYWEIRDRMKTAARYGAGQTEEQIRHQLIQEAQEVGVPAEAQRFRINKTDHPQSVTISTVYTETVDLPLLKRSFTFRPTVTQKF